MTDDEFLVAVGGIVRGHVVYGSGEHGEHRIDRAALYGQPSVVAELGRRIAYHLAHTGEKVECFAVAVGSTGKDLLLADAIAHSYDGNTQALAIQRRSKQELTLPLGQLELIADRQVIVVEGIISPRCGVDQFVSCIRQLGGIVETICAIGTRGEIDAAAIGVKQIISLHHNPISWEPSECPFCNTKTE